MTPSWLEEVPDPTDVTANELQKSRLTRRRILDAAVTILAEQGYTGFSTIAVAKAAAITRPAMLYHFRNREQLVAATVNHVMRKRADHFGAMAEAIVAVPPDERKAAIFASFRDLNGLTTPEYTAFVELAAASRVDAGLARVLESAVAAYEDARIAIARQYTRQGRNFFRKLDVLTTLADGVVLPMRMVENRQAREDAVRRFIGFLATSPEADALFDAAERAGILPSGAGPEINGG